MFNIIVLVIWIITPILIYKRSSFQSYLLFSSLSISVFDNPFNINIYFLFYFGFLYYTINVLKRHHNINIYLLYFLFYNTFITFVVYSIYYYSTDKNFIGIFYIYLVAQFKIIGCFGVYYYLIDRSISFREFNPIYITSLLICIFFGYFIYFGFDSPYHYLKNFGYSTNESKIFSIIRLSGLTQEPRYLAYIIVFCLFTIDFSNYPRIKSFPIKIVLFISLILTKSLSGFMLFILCLFYLLIVRFNSLKFIILFFSITLSLILFFIFNDEYLFLLNQRIFDRNLINFKFLPHFFSYFEHHDLIALKFMEENLFISLFGFGYGQIKNYEAIFAALIDPTMTLFNFNSTVHCCDPQSSLINFISSFGLINLLITSFLYFRNFKNYNILLPFVLFNLFNLPPGPLPFFILLAALSVHFISYKPSK